MSAGKSLPMPRPAVARSLVAEDLAPGLAQVDRAARRRACDELSGLVRDGRVEEPVRRDLLAHADRRVRWGAAFAFWQAGLSGRDVALVALEFLGEDDGDVRWAAARILEPALAEHADVALRMRSLAVQGLPCERKMALLCLGAASPGERTLALAALDDADRGVRLAAITALGRAPDAGGMALAALRRKAHEDPDDGVRRAAAAVQSRLLAAAESGPPGLPEMVAHLADRGPTHE